jgi:hypothetical protein
MKIYFLLIYTIAICTSIAEGQNKRPLNLYFNGSQTVKDNLTATTIGENSAIENSYRFIRIEGNVYSKKVQGTVPLKLYYKNGDNFTTSTEVGINSAEINGYSFVRVEGYVYSKQVEGTVPLRLYFKNGDNFTTGTDEGANSAEINGYSFIRIEGYVFP